MIIIIISFFSVNLYYFSPDQGYYFLFCILFLLFDTLVHVLLCLPFHCIRSNGKEDTSSSLGQFFFSSHICSLSQNMQNHQGHHTTPSYIFSRTSLNKDSMEVTYEKKCFTHSFVVPELLYFYFRLFSPQKCPQ